MKKVFVGLSGGVDSSVAAALLIEQGYDVVGVYMKNWSADVAGLHCPWKEDLASARSVAAHLKIPLKVYDFEKDYKRAVVDYMVKTYQDGLTPNPDIMCNQEIKFKVFAKKCFGEGASFIATGHYARLENGSHVCSNDIVRESLVTRTDVYSSHLRSNRIHRLLFEDPPAGGDENLSGDDSSHIRSNNNDSGDSSHIRSNNKNNPRLLVAADEVKDQTYFLYRMSQEVAKKTLFPLGDYTKSEVRELAKKLGLPTANRKDSQGLCFVGKVPIRDFLSQYIQPKKGDIIDDKGQKVGSHDGAFFYTIGQRHGLGVGGGKPYFVCGKDIKKNIVYVTTDPKSKVLNRDQFVVEDCVWWSQPEADKTYEARIRHGGQLRKAKLEAKGKNQFIVRLSEAEHALSAGQSAVFYDGDTVLGGGVIV